MAAKLANKVLSGGLVTVSSFCYINCILEHVVEFTLLFGPSMIPTFNVKKDGDLIITEHLSAQFKTVKKGDVVVVRSPEDPKCLLCKRIAALSGERVRTETAEEVKIPKGHVWLLGDNPNWSKDSRHFGAVPYGLIRGRAWFKVWPLTEFGKIQNPFDVK
ncbi:mitochondrial inner membrane protease subunit 1-like [Acropora palmata]|uniref:mitochondrial inner membrane protease subunit 1-like n=1 Tax=Acropora palmata TaxID=6131 RepID=UPI003DA05435